MDYAILNENECYCHRICSQFHLSNAVSDEENWNKRTQKRWKKISRTEGGFSSHPLSLAWHQLTIHIHYYWIKIEMFCGLQFENEKRKKE